MKQFLKDLGPVTAIIGAQWGDEGKGKVTDILGEHFDVIARACGGANAGHTIVVNGKKHVFRLLPAGCLHEGKPVILGSGMVIHLPTLLEEIEILKSSGIELLSRLWISGAAHILFNFHKDIDAALEEKRGANSIGTTKKGIGPAYMDKAARMGIRMEHLGRDLSKELKEKAAAVKTMFGVTVDIDKELADLNAAQILVPRVVNAMPEMLHELLASGKRIVIEGAQATLLDLDHGTYPFVTSSFTTAAGALQGLGLPPSALKSCIGIAKAYCTRVGAGDFLTETTGETGDRLRERGGEYGSVTGRPRRTGWIHLPDLKRSALLNGFTAINLTKLDVLDTEKEIQVGVGIKTSGEAIFETLPGWESSTKSITEFSKLPKNAQAYILFIEKRIGVPIRLIGTGQGREEMIVR